MATVTVSAGNSLITKSRKRLYLIIITLGVVNILLTSAVLLKLYGII